MPSPEIDPRSLPHFEPTIGCLAIMYIHDLKRSDNPAQYKDLIAKQWQHIPEVTRAEFKQQIPQDASTEDIGAYWSRYLLERMFEFADDVDRQLATLVSAPELGYL